MSNALSSCRLALQIPPRSSAEFPWFVFWFSLAGIACGVFVTRIYLLKDMIGIFDFQGWLHYTKMFFETGIVYNRDLSLYGPSSGTMGYPPLPIALLIGAQKLGAPENLLIFLLALEQIFCHLGTAFLCILSARINPHWRSLLPLIVACMLFVPSLEDNLTALQLEPTLLFLLAVSLFCLSRNRNFLAGFFTGFAVMLKVYPGIAVIYFLVTRRWTAFAGMIFAAAAASIVSISVLGIDEHVIFYKHIAPLLLKEKPSLFFYSNTSLISYSLYFDLLTPDRAKLVNSALLAVLLVIAMLPALRDAPDKEQDHLRMTLDFSILVAMLVMCMPNSWWNYQIHLLLPIMATAVFLVDPQRFCWPAALVWLSGIGLLFFTITLGVHKDISYFVDMEKHLRMTYIVLRGLPNLLFFSLALWMRWSMCDMKNTPR